jgi:hypothetical protein
MTETEREEFLDQFDCDAQLELEKLDEKDLDWFKGIRTEIFGLIDESFVQRKMKPMGPIWLQAFLCGRDAIDVYDDLEEKIPAAILPDRLIVMATAGLWLRMHGKEGYLTKKRLLSQVTNEVWPSGEIAPAAAIPSKEMIRLLEVGRGLTVTPREAYAVDFLVDAADLMEKRVEEMYEETLSQMSTMTTVGSEEERQARIAEEFAAITANQVEALGENDGVRQEIAVAKQDAEGNWRVEMAEGEVLDMTPDTEKTSNDGGDIISDHEDFDGLCPKCGGTDVRFLNSSELFCGDCNRTSYIHMSLDGVTGKPFMGE